MIMGITKEVDWELLGAILARSTDENQTLFFKSFVKECQSWGTTFQIQTQLACVNNKLDADEREILSMLGFDE